MPNGVILQTVAGVINTIYTGVAGGITYYVPKNLTSDLQIGLSGLSGSIVYNGNLSTQFYGGFNSVDSYSFKNQTLINVQNCGGLANLIALKAIDLNASNCALTAKSIGDILYSAYVDDRSDINYNFTGGTNATASAVYSYLTAQYAIADPEAQVYDVLVNNGGTIQLNP